MPVLFVAHGAPTLVIEKTDYTAFFTTLPEQLPAPKAIVIWSAHWESDVQLAGASERFSTIYDFHGFPPEMYTLKYPAPGNEDIARNIVSRLNDVGIEARLDERHGLDHGAWCPLKLMWPDADVPIVPLSVIPNLPPENQYEIGRLLSSLREEGVLIIASGGIVHNLRKIAWDAVQPVDWAQAFDAWIAERLENWNVDAIFRYRELAPQADNAVPRGGAEHFVPLIYAMGAADEGRRAKRLFQDYQLGSLSLNVWQFD
ncbi:MFS transporter [Cohnella kolymensis]|uniref:MFS transporter n=2 Tax=Cohnella kolymensis TaxID=1590652 RepID=A0ABR5A6T7_9BACL|nr:MFS transporter [Cohnella kolymensis]